MFSSAFTSVETCKLLILYVSNIFISFNNISVNDDSEIYMYQGNEVLNIRNANKTFKLTVVYKNSSFSMRNGCFPSLHFFPYSNL